MAQTKKTNKADFAQSSTFKVAAAAIFAAFVVVATIILRFPIVVTNGYFNLGETVIYIVALVLGPFIGAVAGTGASIADVITGYAQYAPGTFAIKGIEGFIVGFLNKKLSAKIKNMTICASIAVLIGGLEMVLGYFLYETLVLGIAPLVALVEVPLNVLQMLIGLLIAVPVMHGVLRIFPQLRS
jgi:uncharacterized membrane protein